MQKVALILLVSIIGSSCTVLRTTQRIAGSNSPGSESMEIVLAAANITENDFFIRKAEIEIREGEEKQKLIANLKYKKPGVFMISIRTGAGIEIVRIYSDSDSVKINDRMNRRVYLGSARAMFGKYGIDIKALPVVLGDFINGRLDDEDFRIDKYIQGKGIVGSGSLEYTIDNRLNKVIRTKIWDKSGRSEIVIDFSDFKKIKELTCAHKIEIQSIENDLFVGIKIFGVDLLEEDIQEFIPGRNYEKVLLK